MDLYAHIHEIKQLATQPHLYPLFWDEDINNGLTLVNLISLASHENTDIAAMDTASKDYCRNWPRQPVLKKNRIRDCFSGFKSRQVLLDRDFQG
jgi:hypothetical protein